MNWGELVEGRPGAATVSKLLNSGPSIVRKTIILREPPLAEVCLIVDCTANKCDIVGSAFGSSCSLGEHRRGRNPKDEGDKEDEHREES